MKFKEKIPQIIAGLIIAAAFFLMLVPAMRDSAVMDEIAHIPAGYSYVRYLDYRLNPEHPPFTKAFCALPLLFQKVNFPLEKESWKTELNSQWALGTQFLYESGNDADRIIFSCRMMAVLLTLVLLWFIYFWASALLGGSWALLPLALTAFSPNFLAHGHYVTLDVGATLGFLVSLYFFFKFLDNPVPRNSVAAGLAFGFALLMKFSAVLLGPVFIALALIAAARKCLKDKGKAASGFFFKYARGLFLVFAAGSLLVYAAYFLFTFNYPLPRQIADTRATLQTFPGKYLPVAIRAMSADRILRPAGEYLLGVKMVINRAKYGNAHYFRGVLTEFGTPAYFPLVFLMKETLPALIILFAAFLLGARRLSGGVYEDGDRAGFGILLFVGAYWLCSVHSSLNIGLRHVMPTLPFLYLLAAREIKFYFEKPCSHRTKAAGYAVLSGLLVWLLCGAVVSFPNYLSRFNEFFGGNRNGYRFVTDSNFDWGQDLKRLRDWTPPFGEKTDKIAVDYFGGGNVKYYLGGRAELWNSAAGNPSERGIKWLAVSVNTIQNAVSPPDGYCTRKPADEYRWLKNPLSPDYVAGTSIFIYKLPRL
ncbi:MAG: glycosyltransferase family 39 protein [Elusimicrobiaceae bacterium]